MNEIKSFTIYEEYVDLISILPYYEGAVLLKKIIDYVFYNIEPFDLSDKQMKIWKNLKRPIDKSKTQSINGSRGGAPKGNSNAKKQPKNNPKTTQITSQKQTQSKMSMFNVNVNVEKDNRGTGEEEKTTIDDEFNQLWSIYPNKKGKSVAIRKYSLARKQGATYEEVRQGLEHYIEYCEKKNIQKEYIKHGSTWFNQRCWEDDYEENSNTPNWFDKEIQIERSELSDEDRRFIEEIERGN